MPGHTAKPFPDWYHEIRERVLWAEARSGRNAVIADFLRLFDGFEELWMDKHGRIEPPQSEASASASSG